MDLDKKYEIVKFIKSYLSDFVKYCKLRKVLYVHCTITQPYFEFRDQLKIDIQWACAKDINRDLDDTVAELTELSSEQLENVNGVLMGIQDLMIRPITVVSIKSLPKPKRQPLIQCDDETYRKCVLNNHIQLEAYPGNDWTLIDENRMNQLIKDGYKIECFGSAYNTRLPWFGSQNTWDVKWGALGSYETILQRLINCEPLTYNDQLIYGSTDEIRITINPPSGKIQMETYQLINELLEKRPTAITIIFHFSKYQTEIIEDLKKRNIKLTLLTKAWDLTYNKQINMKNREWYECILSKSI